MPITAAQIAAKCDRHLRFYGQTVTIYRGGTDVSTGIAAEAGPTSQGTTKALLLFGEKARELLTPLGLDPNQSCACYFLSTAAVQAEDYLVDAAGGLWQVKSRPNVQPGPATVGIGAALVRVVTKPAGIP